MICKAIALLGPESTPYGVTEDLPCAIQRRVEICAVVDPTQAAPRARSMGLTVYASLGDALGHTGVRCIVYGDAMLMLDPQRATFQLAIPS